MSQSGRGSAFIPDPGVCWSQAQAPDRGNRRSQLVPTLWPPVSARAAGVYPSHSSFIHSHPWVLEAT